MKNGYHTLRVKRIWISEDLLIPTKGHWAYTLENDAGVIYLTDEQNAQIEKMQDNNN